MNLFAILPLVAFFANASLGIYVILRNAKDKLNRLFSIVAFSWAIWALGDFFVFSSQSPQEALSLSVVATIGASLTALFLLQFFLSFIKSRFASMKIYYITYIPAALFIYLSLATNLISKSAAVSWWGYYITRGVLYVPFTSYVIGYVLIGILFCWRFYSKTKSEKERKQSVLLMIAMAVPIAGGTITQIIPEILGFEMMRTTSFLSIISTIIIAYAITRHNLMTPVYFSILRKLILGFLIVTLSLVVFAYISIDASQRELQKSIGGSSSSLVSSILEKIDRDIYYRIEDPQLFSTRITVQEAVIASNNEFDKLGDAQDFINKTDMEWTSVPLEEITPFMKELISNGLSDELRGRIEFYEEKYGYRVFGEMFITNKYGANVAQSGKTSDYNQADEGWWQETKKNGVYVSDVEYDESSGIYSIAIGTKINDGNGTFIGVMKSVLNIEEAIDTLKEAKAASSYSSMALKLMDKSGRIIYDSEGMFKIFQDVSGEEFFKELKGGRGYFVGAAERGENEELFAYATSNGYREFTGLGWTLVLEYEAEEVQRPIIELRNTLLIASVAAILLAILLGFSIYRSISKPLRKLRDAASEIGKGKLDAKIEIKSRDETGELASAFNQMASDLKKSHEQIKKHAEELEQKVQERTVELDSKVKELETSRVAILNMMEDVDSSNKDLVEAQEKLKKSFTELKNLDSEKDTFISIAAHELKTPMTAIHGFAQLLENEKVIKDTEARNKYLKIIEHEVDRLAKLVTEVLDLSRVDLGTIKFSIESVDVAEIAEEVEAELKEKAKSKKLFLKFRKEKDLPTVQTDKERLRQILINIVDNSIKYAEKGGTTVDIAREKDYLKFTVADTGIGIAKEHQAKMFTRFYQVENPLTRKVGGTGLGLSICKEFIEAMGGKIWFESHVGKGTKFFFTIPIKSRVAEPNKYQRQDSN